VGARRDDPLGRLELELTPDRLTPAQQRFAREHSAVPGMCADSSRWTVYMYRTGPLQTTRWLVDAAGNIVDSATFSVSTPQFDGVRGHGESPDTGDAARARKPS